MAPLSGNPRSETLLPVYIISGGNGASGRRLVDTVLVQYPNLHVPIVVMSNTRRAKQVENIIAEASKTGGVIIHTLVDSRLRTLLEKLARDHNLPTLDIMGPLFEHFSRISGQEPLEQPGLYRTLHQSYFDRVGAIEFAMAHDDGKRTEDLEKADIVLLGVSRSGKTPLSMYLAVLGWKVANVVIAPEIPLPENLAQIDRRRVFALDIEHDRLLLHRRDRQSRIGVMGPSRYTRESVVFDELEAARKIYKRYRFATINVSNKAIEASADEILDLLSMRFDL